MAPPWLHTLRLTKMRCGSVMIRIGQLYDDVQIAGTDLPSAAGAAAPASGRSCFTLFFLVCNEEQPHAGPRSYPARMLPAPAPHAGPRTSANRIAPAARWRGLSAVSAGMCGSRPLARTHRRCLRRHTWLTVGDAATETVPTTAAVPREVACFVSIRSIVPTTICCPHCHASAKTIRAWRAFAQIFYVCGKCDAAWRIDVAASEQPPRPTNVIWKLFR